MKPNKLKKLIADSIEAKVTRALYIEGAPGVGKTQVAGQVAAELGIGFQAIHAPLLQPEDYSFPVVSADRTDVNFIVSKTKFPIETSSFCNRGILLIDELAQADNSAQKILANLLQAREIHGNKLLQNWFIIATGNRAQDRAGANRLLSHLGNRVTRIELEVSLDDWTNWAIQNGVKPEVIAFIRFRPELLTNFDPKQDVNATPRAWAEGISARLGAIDPDSEFETFKGDVGQGPATEFLSFLKVFRKLPSPDAILLNPSKSPVPSDPATLYALVGALAYRTTDGNFARVMEYIKRIPPEFSVLFVREVTTRVPELTSTQAFIAWASGDGAKLLT